MIQANKTLGQHFLANKGIIEKIILAAELTEEDTVLEIGPGLGALTFELSKRVKKIIAVEKDKKLAEALKEKLAEQKIDNVEIITGDILEFLSTRYSLLSTRYSVVANIPYYLTSHLIRLLLELENKPENIILMIQKEVAQRICATDKKESLLSISVKFYAEPKILFYVSKGSFLPPPKIDSAVIEITPKKSPPSIEPDKFFATVKAGFSAPKKLLISNLAKKLQMERSMLENVFTKLGIDYKIRAEKLSLDQWFNLIKCLEVEPLNILCYNKT